MTDHENVTQLLVRVREGDAAAQEEVWPLVYDQMRRIAQRQLAGERADHTLNATALVHEAYMKLVGQTRVDWRDRAQFYALAARSMRRILIDYARKRLAEKRGGGQALVTFDESFQGRKDARAEELIDLDNALDRLKEMHERQAKVVELRFFGSLTEEEIAEALKVSVPTVKRDWRVAKAWLAKQLNDSTD